MASASVTQLTRLFQELQLNPTNPDILTEIRSIAYTCFLENLLQHEPDQLPPIDHIRPQDAINVLRSLALRDHKEQFIAAFGWYQRSTNQLYRQNVIDFFNSIKVESEIVTYSSNAQIEEAEEWDSQNELSSSPESTYEETIVNPHSITSIQESLLAVIVTFSRIFNRLFPYNEHAINSLSIDDIKILLESAQDIHYFALLCFRKPIPSNLPTCPRYNYTVKERILDYRPDPSAFYEDPDIFRRLGYSAQSETITYNPLTIDEVLEPHFAIPSSDPLSTNRNWFRECKIIYKMFANHPASNNYEDEVVVTTKKIIHSLHQALLARTDISNETRQKLVASAQNITAADFTSVFGNST